MTDFTDDDLIDIFGDLTYEQGLDYYHSGNVSNQITLGGVLYADVWGRAEEPYQTSVTIEGGDVFTDCTCPVGDMCKHGVAVLLTWMRDPSSFTDGDKALKSLEDKSKEELIKIIKNLLSRHHGLIRETGVSVKSNTKGEGIGNILKDIKQAFDSDYYDGYNLARRLATFKNQADALAENGRHEDAANVYLKIVESCLDVYEETEDEGEDLGSFVIECSEAFEENSDEFRDELKDELIDAVLGLFWRDDWGLGTDGMFSALLNAKNIDFARQSVVRDINGGREGHISRINKDEIIALLGNIYKSFGKPGEKVRIAEECLVDQDDYARLAMAIMEAGDLEGAYIAVMRGLALERGAMPSIRLNELYFELASRLIELKPELIDHRTALIPALGVMPGWFDPGKYAVVSSVFQQLGRLDDLHDALIRCDKNRNAVALALIYDGDVKAAVGLAAKTPDLHPDVLFKIARAAKDKGMPDEATSLLRAFSTRVKRFWEHIPPDDLIDLMVSRSDIRSLKEICDNTVKNRLAGFGAKMIPALAKKSPDLAADLLKGFYRDMPAGAVADASRAIATKLPEQVVAICMSKIDRDCVSSHVHYDDAVLLLKAIRDVYELSGKKSNWPGVLRQFMLQNKGKKKLVSQLETAFGADL